MRIKDYQAFSENPVKPKGVKQVTRYVSGRQEEVVDIDTGEIGTFTSASTPVVSYKDSMPYVKLFSSKEELHPINDLSTPAIKIFSFIISRLLPNKDEISIKYTEVMNLTKYTAKSAYYKGLSELLGKQFLYRKIGSDDTFFINVNLFFNGDRTKLM